MRRSPIVLALVLGLVVGGGAAAAIAATGSSHTTAEVKQPAARRTAAATPGSGRLFVQTATSGTLTEAGHGTFTLRLRGVPATIWFTDRPARASGTVDTGEFVDGWGQGGAGSFANRPPNALLEAREGRTRRVLPVELTKAAVGSDPNTLVYTVRTLPRSPGFYKGEGPGSMLGPGQFRNATVFVDDATTTTCWINWQINQTDTGQALGQPPGVQITGGGTFLWDFDVDTVQQNGNGNILNYGPSTQISNLAGVQQWSITPTQTGFNGGVYLGDLGFFSWLQFNPGSTTITGVVMGSGVVPFADTNCTSPNNGPGLNFKDIGGGSWSWSVTPPS